MQYPRSTSHISQSTARVLSAAGLVLGFLSFNACSEPAEAPGSETVTVNKRQALSSAHTDQACDHDHDEDNDAEVRAHAAERKVYASKHAKPKKIVSLKVVGFNDFHGQLASRTVASRPAGGAAVLASYIEQATLNYEGRSLIVHAGDHVGASPPSSALLQDEPAIQFLNLLANSHCSYRKPDHPKCNVVGTLGNHEFDEGTDELLRLIDGGNHEDGPFLESPYRGARFAYVNANVVKEGTEKTLLAPYVIKELAGVKVGVIGAVLKETPTIVTPSGVAGLEFLDEATSINNAVVKLKQRDVETILVTIHQGGRQTSYEGPTQPDPVITGAITSIVEQLDDAVDLVISGHAHSFTNGILENQNGTEILVTQAFSASTAYADIVLEVDKRSGDVVSKSAAIVTTWADVAPGNAPNPEVAAIVAGAEELTAPLVNQVVSQADQAILDNQNAAGESALGNLIADAQRSAMGTDFAFMNPGGIRADLDAGPVTWGDLFTIQPFGNSLVRMTLTGAQVITLLEQQWLGQPFARQLQISGLSYTWDNARPVGERIVQVLTQAGTPLDPTAEYTVTVNSFIAAGGDNFTVLPSGTNQVGGPVDLDALIDYIEALGGSVAAAIEGRVTRLN